MPADEGDIGDPLQHKAMPPTPDEVDNELNPEARGLPVRPLGHPHHLFKNPLIHPLAALPASPPPTRIPAGVDRVDPIDAALDAPLDSADEPRRGRHWPPCKPEPALAYRAGLAFDQRRRRAAPDGRR